MSTSRIPLDDCTSANLPLVAGCVPDQRVRARLHSALRGHATVQWVDSYLALRAMALDRPAPGTIVVAMSDASGAPVMSFIVAMRAVMAGSALVVHCDSDDGLLIAQLVEAGAHEILFAGINDEGYVARTAILGAATGAAADAVMRIVRGLIPDGMAGFVEAAVRRPRDLQRVRDVATAVRVPRQTLARWCRDHRYVRPEELLVWARLLLVAALLESTTWPLETIAAQLGYGSASALHNRIREYVGMTSVQIRAAGMEVVVDAFAQRVDRLRRPQSDLARATETMTIAG